MFKFKRTRNAAKKTTAKTYTYVRDDLLNIKEAQGHYQDIKELANTHLNPFRKREGRNETFAHAMERMGLTMEDVQQAYKFYSFRFNLFAFFFGAALFMAGWGITQQHWMMAVGAVPALLIFTAQLFNASFRCFQIRHHELLPASAWWRHRSEWIPGEYTAPKASKSLRKRKGR